MTDSRDAAISIEAAAKAQQRARSDAGWFPWLCIILGLFVIPAGTVVPWEWPARLIVTATGFALLLGLVFMMGRMGVTPRGSRGALNVAVGCWIGLSAVIAALGSDIEIFGPAIACSALASIPFLVVAVRFWSQRNVLR